MRGFWTPTNNKQYIFLLVPKRRLRKSPRSPRKTPVHSLAGIRRDYGRSGGRPSDGMGARRILGGRFGFSAGFGPAPGFLVGRGPARATAPHPTPMAQSIFRRATNEDEEGWSGPPRATDPHWHSPCKRAMCVTVPDVSTHFLSNFGPTRESFGMARGTSFLGPRGRFRAPGRGI